VQVVNTVQQHGSGVTWSGGRRGSHRVDYILLDVDTKCMITDIRVDYKAAHELQLPHCYNWLDHAPLVMDFMYVSWYMAEEEYTGELDAPGRRSTATGSATPS
jgi:hypothetical protein